MKKLITLGALGLSLFTLTGCSMKYDIKSDINGKKSEMTNEKHKNTDDKKKDAKPNHKADTKVNNSN